MGSFLLFCLQVHLFFHPSYSFCYWAHTVFLFWWLYFSVLYFPFCSFLCLLFLCWNVVFHYVFQVCSWLLFIPLFRSFYIISCFCVCWLSFQVVVILVLGMMCKFCMYLDIWGIMLWESGSCLNFFVSRQSLCLGVPCRSTVGGDVQLAAVCQWYQEGEAECQLALPHLSLMVWRLSTMPCSQSLGEGVPTSPVPTTSFSLLPAGWMEVQLLTWGNHTILAWGSEHHLLLLRGKWKIRYLLSSASNIGWEIGLGWIQFEKMTKFHGIGVMRQGVDLPTQPLWHCGGEGVFPLVLIAGMGWVWS